MKILKHGNEEAIKKYDAKQINQEPFKINCDRCDCTFTMTPNELAKVPHWRVCTFSEYTHYRCDCPECLLNGTVLISDTSTVLRDESTVLKLV